VLKFKKHFIEILLLLEKSPMSFNELLKALNAYPDTLNRRLKELQSLNLIVQFEENGKIKYKLTDKGLKLIPLLRNLLKIIDEIKSLLS
jgi:DNA-binding HxlR family transcriptional regulator